MLLTDLSQTFDCISHEPLIAKLHVYCFSLELLKFIQSYLYLTKSKKLKSTLILVTMVTQNGQTHSNNSSATVDELFEFV